MHAFCFPPCHQATIVASTSTCMSLKDRIWDTCKAFNTSGKTIRWQTAGSSSKISHCRMINNMKTSQDQYMYIQVKIVKMTCLWYSRYCLTGKNILLMSQLCYIVFINPEKGRNFYFTQLGRNLGGIIFYTFVS